MPATLEIDWIGERLLLSADRCVRWPTERTVFIADPHFGKAATFRRAGVPVPQATLDDDVARLDRLIDDADARRLVVLGDFFHARSGRCPETMETLTRWRHARPTLDVILVRGNHDRQAGDPPADWRIRCVDEGERLGPFVLCHFPEDETDAKIEGFRLCGHVHPGVVLRDGGKGTLRLPCFHVGPTCFTLPAFGGFTGLHPIKPTVGDRLFPVAEGCVVEARLTGPVEGSAFRQSR
ncbi:MAG: ligase-associated DNA damage response endonuclease PdeM [Planctomycetia bacterium]